METQTYGTRQQRSEWPGEGPEMPESLTASGDEGAFGEYEDLLQGVIDNIRAHPLTYLGLAVAAGYLASKVLDRPSSNT